MISRGGVAAPAVGERIYLHDDPALHVEAERDPNVRQRHRDRYKWAVEALVPAGGMWLDCACGSGYGTAMMGAVAPVVGVDPSGQAIEYARKHHGSFNVSYIEASCSTVWSLVGPVGAVVSVETLEHLTKRDQHRFISQTAEFLIPRGKLALTCPVRPRSIDLKRDPSITYRTNPHHLYEPQANELERLLKEYFPLVKIQLIKYQSTYGPAVQAFALCQK